MFVRTVSVLPETEKRNLCLEEGYPLKARPESIPAVGQAGSGPSTKNGMRLTQVIIGLIVYCSVF